MNAIDDKSHIKEILGAVIPSQLQTGRSFDTLSCQIMIEQMRLTLGLRKATPLI